MSEPHLAFVFPGQGSQSKGMLAEMAQEHLEVLKTFEQASAVLGYDLWALSQTDESGQIDMTEVTQPLLLTASVALWRVWQFLGGPQPQVLAGHSLGEWSALVCAGVVKFEDAIELVRARGQFMQEAVPAGVGSMAAIIGLDDETTRQCCEQAALGEVVVPVNYNAPGQVVIAGHKSAIDRAVDACKAAGAKRAMPLAVSAPFHSDLMQPAAEKLAPLIEKTDFHSPELSIVHNVNAKTEADPDAIKKLMIQQIYQPVLWVDCVRALAGLGVNAAVECGSGKVLNGLMKRIDKSIKSYSTDAIAAINSAVDELNA
ncbi:ACP S-malonyltransferase [Halioxenophilus aromaticivorans]|uniref:Malonyl CoA-acyl carrier protein transacylase n=1 Tax=Halioxenophilus aromaticivorans TaxID=1306992 RepID=A0AAV3UAB3_9ALTE